MSTTQNSIHHTEARTSNSHIKHPYRALSALYIAAFTGMYSETAMNIILPTIGEQFHVSTSLTQWLVVGYMLMIGLVLPFSSILIKHFTIKSLSITALGAFFIGALISALSPNFALLVIGRAIQGIGLGLALPMTFSLLLEIFPPHKLGAAMGFTSLIIMLAPVVGPTFAGIISGTWGWRFVFWSIALLAVAGIVCAVLFLVNPYTLTKPPVDIVSVVLSILGFGSLVLGAGIASEFGWISAPVLSCFVIGIIALVLYGTRQWETESPIINLRAFSYRDFSLGVTLVMLNFGITLTVMFLLPQFLQNSLAVAVSLSGLALLPGGVMNALTSVFSGRSYNKIGGKLPSILGFALAICGLVLVLIQTQVAHPMLALVILGHVIAMIGVPLAMSPLQTYTLSTLPRELNPDGSTIMNTLQQVVGAIFTAIATSLLMAGQHSVSDQPAAIQFSHGTRWGIIFALCIAAFGLLGSLFVHDTRKTVAQSAQNTHDEAEPMLSKLMKTDVYTISDTATAMDAMRLLTAHGISGAPVVNDAGNLVGFISDGDILRLVADQTPEFTSFYSTFIEHNSEEFSTRVRENINRPVTEFMHTPVITVNSDDSMAHICEVLVSHHLKKVPVMDAQDSQGAKTSGRMLGILNRSDVLKYVVDHF
ncbi:MFS transporter [Alloscardovia criceti]|uniref:MFS transporter n=1 Tax=Alloscardovia criceti TaxID=356828 RepID=UPI0003828F1E|nr:MFS transporter [Alloscardovia criceti]